MVLYRFPDWKGEDWNSRTRHQEKYEIIKPYLGQDSIGAEIGVDQGGFGELLLPHCKMLFLVDPWDDRDEVFHSVHKVYENDINVRVERQRSLDFMSKLADNSFDFFYIDASHHYRNVLRDISRGFQKLKPGGYLTGDDWIWESVSLALTHFSEAYGIELIPLESSQWVMLKPTT